MTKGTVDGICSDDHRHLPKPGGVRDSKVSTNGSRERVKRTVWFLETWSIF